MLHTQRNINLLRLEAKYPDKNIFAVAWRDQWLYGRAGDRVIGAKIYEKKNV